VLSNCRLVHVQHLLDQIAEYVIGSESLTLGFCLDSTAGDEVFDNLEVHFFFLLLLRWFLILDELVEKHHHACLQLILSQFESLGSVALGLSLASGSVSALGLIARA